MKMFLFNRVWFCLCVLPIIPAVLGNEVHNEILCADPECTVPISYANALLQYNHIEKLHMSFKKGERMAILQKPVPEDIDKGFWFACIIEPSDNDNIIKIDINGNNTRSGLVPSKLLKEFKKFHKSDSLLRIAAVMGRKETAPENTIDKGEELKAEPQVENVIGGVAAEIGDRGPPRTPFEVVAGTTIFEDLGGDSYTKSTESQPIIKTSIPLTSFLDPTNVQSELVAKPSIIKHEDDEDGFEEEANEDDDDEEEEDDLEEENNTDGEFDTKEPIVQSVEISSHSSINKQEVNINPTHVSTESTPIKTTDIPKENIRVVKETIKEKTEPEHTSHGLMSSFIDSIDTALNSEPGKSAENDEMILKQFSSKVPFTSHVVDSLNYVDTFSLKIPKAKEPSLITETTPISNDNSIEPLASSEGIISEKVKIGTDIPKKEENSLPKSDEPNGVNLSEKQNTTDEALQNVAVDFNENANIGNDSGVEQSTPDIPMGNDQLVDENKDIEQVLESQINEQTVEKELDSNQVQPQIYEANQPKPDSNKQNSPDEPAENLSNVIPHSIDDSSLHSDIPISAPEIFNDLPQVQKPAFTHGQIYPGLIQKSIPTTPDQVVSIKPVSDIDIKSPQEDQNTPTVTEVPPISFKNNEKLSIDILSETPQNSIMYPSETHPNSIVDVNTMESEILEEDQSKENIKEQPAGVSYIEELTPQFPDRTAIEEDTIESSSGMVGSITGLFSGLFGSEPASSENETLPLVEENTPTSHSEVFQMEVEAVSDGECKTVTGLESECSDAPTPQHLFHFFEKTVPPTSYTTLYLIVTSVTVLLFTLGYYFIEQTRRDGPLVAKVNQLTHELQVATSQLQSKGIDTNDEQYIIASNELLELKNEKLRLEEQVDTLQMELDGATEAGLELNKMMSDLLFQQEGSGSVLKSVEQLQGQLNGQQLVIDNMNRNLVNKSEENNVLQSELLAAQEKVEGLEEKLVELRESIEQLLSDKESAIWELESRNTKLESDLVSLADNQQKEIAELTKKNNNDISELKTTLDEVNRRLKKRESEFHALDTTIKKLQGQSQVDVKAIYDIGLINAELDRTRTEKETLQERLEDEEGARKLLEDHVKKVDEEVAELRSSFQVAEKDKIDAETRLTVLSKYFKEKEAHLQKELGLQEAMWVQKQGDDTTVYERMKSLQEEVESYNFDSLQYSNEGLSVTNSLSSMCTDSPSSISNLPSISISLEGNETQSNSPPPHPLKLQTRSIDSPEQRSLPITPVPKPRFLKRRKSSADFEARLGCVESMITPKSQIIIRPIPDDLMKLQELKTVRASPFKDTSLSPELLCESSTALFNTMEPCSGSFSKVEDQFQKLKSPKRSSQSPDSNFSFDLSIEYPLKTLKPEDSKPKCSLLVDKFEKLRQFPNKVSFAEVETKSEPPSLIKIEETGTICSELEEFQTVRASPYNDTTCLSPEPFSESSTALSDTMEPCSGSFSKLVDQFQKLKSPNSNFSFDSSIQYPLKTLKPEDSKPKLFLLVDKFEKMRQFTNKVSFAEVETNSEPSSLIKIEETGTNCSELEEFQKVRASPYNDTTCFSPEPLNAADRMEPYSGSFSKLVDQFQKLKSPNSNFSFDSSIEYPLKTLKPEDSKPKLFLLVNKFEKLRPFANKVSFAEVESHSQPNNFMKIKGTGIKCSELVDRFEKIRKVQLSSPSINFPLINSKNRPEDILQIYDTSDDKDGFEINNILNFPDKPIPVEPLALVKEDGVPYYCNNIADTPIECDCTEIVLPTSSTGKQLNSQSDSEDSQSVNKECELSTARLELDIKVVANSSTKVKKFKKKSSRQKKGAQNEGLKKEIIDQERGLKGRIASLEKKAHESWVAARQAERRLDESKQEAGQLRNIITLIEKSNATETDGKITQRHTMGDLNGDSLPPLLPDGTSPLPLPPLTPSMLPPGFMPPFMPPPIDGFLPPPPFLSGDHRPPPLGRMSSPPLNRYSPNPVDYSYDRLSSPPPLSPPERDYRSPPADSDRYPRSPISPWQDLSPRSSFRPVTSHRDSHKSYQGSNPSSAHSSSESLHKPAKRIDKYSKNVGHSKK